MANKEDSTNNVKKQDDKHDSQQLEKQISDLKKAHEELFRQKNAEKFAALGRMTRALAHEIRNPLTNISLALEQLMAEIPQNDDVSLLFDMINRNALRINALITDVLNSTKFAQLSFSQVSINEILENVINQVSHFAKQKNVHIEEHLAHSLPELMLDTEKIKTAFENLLVNSIETVPPNEGFISITTAKENNKCVVTIRNNGSAISPETIERLFEPHFSAKNGSGLALTHSQNIILNHGGNIYVESEPGKGNTFTIVLEFA